MLTTYQSYQFYAQDLSKTLARTRQQPVVERDTAYYQATIGKVKTVGDFVNNYRLFSYAMKAYGLEDKITARGLMTKVLESDLADPHSYVNSLNDGRYKAFAAAFSFASSGKAVDTTHVQADDQEHDTLGLYSAAVNKTLNNATTETTWFQQNIGAVTSVGDLVKNTRLYDYVLKAYGLDPNTTPASQVTAALTSTPNDPRSFANISGNAAYQALARGFNFQSDGTVSAHTPVQSAAQQSNISNLYSQVLSSAVNSVAADAKYYSDHIGSVKSIQDLESNTRLYDYVLTAYGIDPTTTSKATVTAALDSDLSDPKSFANAPGARSYSAATGTFTQSGPNAAFQALASDFNFDATGAVSNQRLAQSAGQQLSAVAAYTLQVKSGSAAAGKTETTYYQAEIGKVKSLSDLLGNQRLVTYITKAYGMAADQSDAKTLRDVLTSDLSNPDSIANTLGDSTRKLAAAFNFASDGTIDREPSTEPQSAKTAIVTSSLYARVTAEDEAGKQNPAVKQALYFERLASTITNPYVILADKSLLSVAQTVLNIPATSSKQDIDVQAKTITDKLNLADLQDPVKLKKFIERFTILYDLNNPPGSTGPAPGTVASLFSGTPQFGLIL